MIAKIFSVYAPDNLSDDAFNMLLAQVDSSITQSLLKQRNKQVAITRLFTHLLLNFTLATEYGLDLKRMVMHRGNHIKPFFSDENAPHFSLSHSGRVGICALHDNPIGVDVEKKRPITDALAKRIMSSDEFSTYLTSTEKIEYFFKIWTLKESYLKFNGEGITRSLSNVSFKLETIQNGYKGTTLIGQPEKLSIIDHIEGYAFSACIKCGELPTFIKNVTHDHWQHFTMNNN